METSWKLLARDVADFVIDSFENRNRICSSAYSPALPVIERLSQLDCTSEHINVGILRPKKISLLADALKRNINLSLIKTKQELFSSWSIFL